MTGKDKVLFICAIENKRPSPALGWAAGQRVNSFLHTQRGSGGKEAQQSRRREPDLSSATGQFASACLSLKTQTVISTLQTSTQDLLDFPPIFNAPFLARGTPLSASNCYFVKSPVAPIVPLIPVPALKHDCRVAVKPHQRPPHPLPHLQTGCLSEEDATNMWWDRANTRAGMHAQVLPRVVWSVWIAYFGIATRIWPRCDWFFVKTGISLQLDSRSFKLWICRWLESRPWRFWPQPLEDLPTFHLYDSRENVVTGASGRSQRTRSNMIGFNFSLQELLTKFEQVYTKRLQELLFNAAWPRPVSASFKLHSMNTNTGTVQPRLPVCCGLM